jgi:glycosyltransferase involved in cell wall biosynthesis
MRRLKILAIAYACNPASGSESGVGWGWVSAIAKDHDVTVITADYNSDDLTQFMRNRVGRERNNPHFLYVKNRPWHYRPSRTWLAIEDSIAKPIMNLAYHDWLRHAFTLAQNEIVKSSYDIVHLITYVGWRFPGRFYGLGIPFVWGPIGGMKNTPWRLLPILGFKGAVYYGGRNLINSLQLHMMRQPGKALRAAAGGVIAATSEIQDELTKRFRVTSRVICEVGPPDFAIEEPNKRALNETFRICWSGLHLPGKALQLLLRAAASLPNDMNYCIEILGDGPCSKSWRSLAAKLGIENRCHWHGWLPRERSLAVMMASHAFVITSLKDLTSTVAVEALSLGLPIVSLDHCGFADLVTEDCGIKIYPGSAKQIQRDIAAALSKLYIDEPRRFQLAQGAVSRSAAYSWQEKMKTLEDIYQQAAASAHAHDGLAESEFVSQP